MKRLPNPLVHAVRRAPRRRGVLLLVVLSLLVLFALLGITYALVAGQYLRTTRIEVRNERVGNDPKRLMESVLGQIVRGTNNPHSVIRGHDLLGDLYGNDGIAGTVRSVAQYGNGQLLDLTVNISPLFTFVNNLGNVQNIVSDDSLNSPGYFNGCVLTMVEGTVGRNISTRIVGWTTAAGIGTNAPAVNGVGTATVRVMTPDGMDPLQFGSMVGRCIINGRPFNGTGFGFNTELPAGGYTITPDFTFLDAVETLNPSTGLVTVPYVYLPNPVFSHRSDQASGLVTSNAYYRVFGGIGGADEGYDAADVQNMLVAYLPLNPLTPGPGINVLPSLHRPDTIQYLRNRYAAPMHDPDLVKFLNRQSTLRPDEGTNDNFPKLGAAIITGPFDVDNDQDGYKESIWVDAGLPVQSTPDGRLFKPLVALLVLDRDSRLNVNAAGTTAHVDSYYLTGMAPAIGGGGELPPSSFPPGSTTNADLPRGSGIGPAEINLLPLFTPLGTPIVNSGTLSPAYANLLAERYREPNSNLIGAPNAVYDSVNSTAGSPKAGITNYSDPLSGADFTGYPTAVRPWKPAISSSMIDIQGVGMQWLDVTGMPVRRYGSVLPAPGDHPYELNLSHKVLRASSSPAVPPAAIAAGNAGTTPNPVDSPFTVAELERVLRLYDLDAQELPDRLRRLIDPALNGAAGPPLVLSRNMITTDSIDLPSPAIHPTGELRNIAATQAPGTILAHMGVADMLRVRLAKAGVPAANMNAMIQQMIPPELLAGLRFDINRQFGNGRDDDVDGVVDEPDEVEIQYWSSDNTGPASFTANILPNITNGLDLNNSGAIDIADKRLARQLYARYLYLLMMLLRDTNAKLDYNGDSTDGNNDPETAYALAQWAVNVVDFRDRDSIMTGFEFDIDPFNLNSWSVDGDLTTTGEPDRGVVWGCERPELLISETLAWHDKRVQNLNTENPDPTLDMSMATMGGLSPTDPDPMRNDTDYDQELKPFGPFFIELYNPWHTQTSVKDPAGRPATMETSGEYYAVDPTVPTSSGVYLQKASPAGNSPLWRMVVVKGPSRGRDPDNPLPGAAPAFSKADVDRAIYFRDPGAAITDLPNAISYFPQRAPAPILPGRYGVVGSAGLPGRSDLAGMRFVSPIGRLTTADPHGDQVDSTRRIELLPQGNPYVNQVFVYNNGVGGTFPSPFGETIGSPELGYAKPAIAIALTGSRVGAVVQSFPNMLASITEPKDGYASLQGTSSLSAPVATRTPNSEQKYNPPLDIPFDQRNPNLPANAASGPVFTHASEIHLQRLADPTQPWDVNTNPYLTIDTMSIVPNVFNGVEAGDPDTPGALTALFSSQRGEATATVGTNFDKPWSQEPPMTAPPANALGPPTGAIHHANVALNSTLGYLNRPYGQTPVGVYISTDTTMLPGYLGMPKNNAYGELTWLNRPFISPMEMMLVPKTRSSRLLFDYGKVPANLYEIPPAAAINTRATGHLLNFFATPIAPAPSLGLEGLFEYLHVPSPFAGTRNYLDPNRPEFGTMNPGPLPGQNNIEFAMMSFFHTPFNHVSSYRDPGKLNINLIPSDTASNTTSSIWNGYLAGAAGPTWQKVQQSRQGTSNTVMPGDSPTIFNNPFRSAGEVTLQLPDAINKTNRQNIDVTMLRPSDANSATVNDQPLFNYFPVGVLDDPNGGSTMTRHAPLRFRNLRRTSNLLTTRSNVYAIWITVGYFEVTPAPDLVEHPDGYAVGAELGSDTGEVKRHRAFFIYDRSIPVAYEPGKDHNYQDGLLLKRFIE